MTQLFLDTEFDGFKGELISMALVPAGGWVLPEFYEVKAIPANPHPWVRDHVIPILNAEPVGPAAFRRDLHTYLLACGNDTEIVADWPEDIALLCAELVGEGGWQLSFFPTFRLVNSGTLSPATPHNALSDARALRDWVIGKSS